MPTTPSCIYPRLAAQPMREDALLTGALEPTNEPYAVAKIAFAPVGAAPSPRMPSIPSQRGAAPTKPSDLYGPASIPRPLPRTKPNTLSVSERLSRSEIDLLRQKKKSIADYAQKAFAGRMSDLVHRVNEV